jgi:hypothetical protein
MDRSSTDSAWFPWEFGMRLARKLTPFLFIVPGTLADRGENAL